MCRTQWLTGHHLCPRCFPSFVFCFAPKQERRPSRRPPRKLNGGMDAPPRVLVRVCVRAHETAGRSAGRRGSGAVWKKHGWLVSSTIISVGRSRDASFLRRVCPGASMSTFADSFSLSPWSWFLRVFRTSPAVATSSVLPSRTRHCNFRNTLLDTDARDVVHDDEQDDNCASLALARSLAAFLFGAGRAAVACAVTTAGGWGRCLHSFRCCRSWR